MTSPVTEAMFNVRAFSVQHLLEMRDDKDVICHPPQQQQQNDRQVDDTDATDSAGGRGLSQLASAAHDDPATTSQAAACLLAGAETSLSPVTASASRHGRYADMPDLVQASCIAASCCHEDNPYARWIQSSASLDYYYSGLRSIFITRYLRKGCGSIVMRMSVCLSVREDISRTTCAIYTKFSARVAYGRGSVLHRQGDEILRGMGNFWGCPDHSKALVIFAAAVAAAFAEFSMPDKRK